MTRTGYVADAAIAVLADRLSAELPGLEQEEIHRIARAQAAQLTRDGYRITVPVTVLATTARRTKTGT